MSRGGFEPRDPYGVRNRIYYLTAPGAVRAFGTWCVTAGETVSRPGERYPPDELQHPHRYRSVSADGRVLAELQIVYIAEGEGIFEDRRHDPRRVSGGDCFVLAPGAWHRYHPAPETGWREYWVGVSGDAVLRATELLGIPARGPVLRPAAPDEVVGVYERLLELASVHDAPSHVEMAAHVLHLVALIARGEVSPKTYERHLDRLELATRAMRHSLHGRLSVPDLARDCGMSDAGFRRFFRERTGSSPYRYYMALKVNAVKMELAHSALPLKAIAARFGFSDQYHLSRVFREYTGVAPTVWRRRGG